MLIVGCGGVRPPPPEYPGSMIAAGELHSVLGDAFSIDQHVESHSEQGDYEFRAVLQKRGDTLTLVGLAPHGGRAFVLTQSGDEVSFESHMPRELPFPPRYMLLDVQRTFFRGIGGVQSDGEHEERIDGEEVSETWSEGRLRRRVYRRDDRPQSSLTIEYVDGMGENAAPSEVRIDNGWFGYRLVIRTLNYQAIN
jgi:hypothetical protein